MSVNISWDGVSVASLSLPLPVAFSTVCNITTNEMNKTSENPSFIVLCDKKSGQIHECHEFVIQYKDTTGEWVSILSQIEWEVALQTFSELMSQTCDSLRCCDIISLRLLSCNSSPDNKLPTGVSLSALRQQLDILKKELASQQHAKGVTNAEKKNDLKVIRDIAQDIKKQIKDTQTTLGKRQKGLKQHKGVKPDNAAEIEKSILEYTSQLTALKQQLAAVHQELQETQDKYTSTDTDNSMKIQLTKKTIKSLQQKVNILKPFVEGKKKANQKKTQHIQVMQCQPHEQDKNNNWWILRENWIMQRDILEKEMEEWKEKQQQDIDKWSNAKKRLQQMQQHWQAMKHPTSSSAVVPL